jgi:hypothetical protein
MTPLFEAALALQDFFIRRQWQFCLIGGIALPRWESHGSPVTWM